MLAEVRAFLDLSRERHSYSANTLRAIQEDLLYFSSYLVTNLGRAAELGDFNREQIAAFLRSERLRPVAVRTLRRRQTSLRVFARYLLQYHPDGDFALPEAITVPQEAAGRSASGTRSLTTEQIEAVQLELGRSKIVHARRDAAILSLCLTTGISVEELLALNVADFRLSEGVLLLRGKNNLLRRVPVGDAVGPMQTYLAQGRLEIGPLPGENALFISRSGARLTRQGVWLALRYWGEAARLCEPLTPRSLRTTAVCRMVAEGRSLKQIQTSLGHTSSLSTLAMLKRLTGSNA
jgi:integrase/recombinase XerD